MRTLHHPTTGFDAGLAFERLRFFPPRPNVGGEAKLFEGGPDLSVIIPFVQPHALGLLVSGTGALDPQTLDGVLDQLHIGTIGSSDYQAHRPPLTFGQQTTLDAALGAIRGIGAGFFPLHKGPWSSPHPYSATSSPGPSVHRTAPPPLSRTSQRPPLPPILETDHGPGTGGTGPGHPMPPTDSLCGGRRKWHRHTGDRAPVGVRPQTDECFYASGALAPTPPRGHPKRDSWRLLGSPRPAAESVWG